MNWLKIFQKKEPRTDKRLALVLDGRAPIFSLYGKDIYAYDVVQQAMGCIVNETKKLIPKHIWERDGLVDEVPGSVSAMLREPNELMTTSDFLEKITWQLLLKYNSFIYPEYEWVRTKNGRYKKEYRAMYPLQPSQVDFLQDRTGVLFVKMKFVNGYETTLPYSDVIHLRTHYSLSPYMGGNEQGQPDNDALLKILQVNDDLMEGVARNAKNPVNAIVTYNGIVEREELEKSRKEFERALKNNESGILPMDMGGTYTPLSTDKKLIDKDTMQFIDEKILRHIGVSVPVLMGTATPEEKQAFFERTIEPFVIGANQAFSRVVLSKWQKQHNQKINFYHKDLMFMSVDQTINMIKEVGGRGALTNNQILAAFGYPPYEGGNVRLMSLNYVDVNIANQYQLSTGEGEQNETAQ